MLSCQDRKKIDQEDLLSVRRGVCQRISDYRRSSAGRMKITLLGTGDAIGTPKIGCKCPACIDALRGGRSRRTEVLSACGVRRR